MKLKARNIAAVTLTAFAFTFSTPSADGQAPTTTRKPDDIRVCTPDEIDFIEKAMNPAGDKHVDGDLNSAPPGEADWLTEGTEANEVAQEIYDFWTKEIGTSGAFAAGVLANVEHESQFIPNVSEGGGRFPSQFATQPDSGGPGGGLYQFTPYSKYVNTPHFAQGGWTPRPQSKFVWDSEFISGSVDAGMKNAPNLYGIEPAFLKAYTLIPTDRNGDYEVLLDKDALITATDPARASKGFQTGYERPAQYHIKREERAVQANEVFNPHDYRGDAEKIKENLPQTALAGEAYQALDTLGSMLDGSLEADPKKHRSKHLFPSPCKLPDGYIITDLDSAYAYARQQCEAGGHGAGDGIMETSKDGKAVITGGEEKLKPNARNLAYAVRDEYPEINTIGGWRLDPNFDDHPSGHAIDVMIPEYNTAKGEALGDDILAFIWANADKYNVKYTIWKQEYQDTTSKNIMEDRGNDTQNHFDHIHVTVEDGSSEGGKANAAKNLRSQGTASSTGLDIQCGGTGTGGGAGDSIQVDGELAIPADGVFTSGWGPRWGSFHYGVDIANDVGTKIYAVADGKVVSAGPADGYGIWLQIEHEGGWMSEYGHQTTNHVSVGDTVKAGEHIADMGNKGQSTGPHLHLTIYENGQRVDPAKFFRDNGVDFPEVGGTVKAG